MNVIANQSRILNEVDWADPDSALHHDISAWGQMKHFRHGQNSKSLELKKPTFRPKLMLPRPARVKKSYREVIVSPSEMSSRASLDTKRVEGIIFKLIEKSRITAAKLKKIGQMTSGQRLSSKIPFMNYKLNLPRSLNTLKTPNIKKRAPTQAVVKPDESNFTYYLTGISLNSKGNSPSTYLS